MTEVATILGAPRVAVVGLVLDDEAAEDMERMRMIYQWALRARDLAHPAEPGFDATGGLGLAHA
ncbi:MAG TPA: hypothetical protein VGR28_05425 [Candidatus Thermoplasmatota archaeon]|jgi:hypothetical protein|nr:hypothetical protein [Candidatus Thermoplasmatota archaeon]